ncbi:radial spoke head 14 homolog [Boleophthalmus pectinirostris]|uniref:radial spoke head 14 homolog n=1 Tax=Boleophthalmus pectinirostris TaxID=150288 RepID=UPI00242F9E97|nr:radial spoke head 14 homolog [Boleophthalmus pectinirostris]
MALAAADRSRAPVVFGLRAVPRLFEELQRPEPEHKTRALNSLCDLLHEPERLYQTVTSGLLEQLGPLLRDSDSGVRTRTCDLLHLVSAHAIGRRALLSSSLLGPLSLLLDDPDPDCRVSVHRVLNRLCLLPLGAEALLSLVPKLILKLRGRVQETDEELGGKGGTEELGRKEGTEEGEKKVVTDEELGSKEAQVQGGSKEGAEETRVELGDKEANDELGRTEEEERGSKEAEEGGDEQGDTKEEELVLLLSTLARCIRLDALPALASGAVELLRHKLTHGSAHVRREAAAALLALSVPVEGKQQICALDLLSDLLPLLHDPDVEVRTNAAGVCMNTLIITAGKVQALKLGLLPVLLDLVSPEDLGPDSLDLNQTLDQTQGKALVLYCLRALTALSEAPAARCLLMEQRPRLERRRDTDPELRQATETALRVISWTP